MLVLEAADEEVLPDLAPEIVRRASGRAVFRTGHQGRIHGAKSELRGVDSLVTAADPIAARAARTRVAQEPRHAAVCVGEAFDAGARVHVAIGVVGRAIAVRATLAALSCRAVADERRLAIRFSVYEGQRYNVGGILLERPFKIRRLGHFGFNINKLEEARHFYGDLLGFTISDKADFSRAPWFPKDGGLGDTHGYFMRYGTDHHAMVLFSKPVMDQRADRKFAPEVTINQITWQCGGLKEIAEAHSYFEEQQVPIQPDQGLERRRQE